MSVVVPLVQPSVAPVTATKSAAFPPPVENVTTPLVAVPMLVTVNVLGPTGVPTGEIGRASCRERVYIWGVVVPVQDSEGWKLSSGLAEAFRFVFLLPPALGLNVTSIVQLSFGMSVVVPLLQPAVAPVTATRSAALPPPVEKVTTPLVAAPMLVTVNVLGPTGVPTG